ncbi:MAG: hypothetical protein AAFV62_02505 [Pseudomonadota bacterium]
MFAIVPSQTDPTKPIMPQFLRDLLLEATPVSPFLKRAYKGDVDAQSRLAAAGAMTWICLASVIGYPFIWLTAALSGAAITAWMSLLVRA